MRKFKIGFDTFVFRMQEYGGMSTMFESIFKNLTTVEVVFLEKIPQNWEARLEGLTDVSTLKTNKGKLNRIKALLKFTEKPKDVDIVHLTYYKDYLSKELDNKPLVLTVCDFIPERFPDYFKSDPHADKIALIRKADLVFCISQTTAEDLKFFVPDFIGKIVITPLASKFTLAGRKLSDTNNLVADKRPYVLYVGRRDAYKNTDIILELIEVYKNYELVLFGGGNLTPSEKLILGENGISRTYCISGDDSVLQDLYQNANCLIYPSRWEGFGLPILEAISLGCPVICSDIKVFEELFENGVKYFDTLSIESLGNCLDSLNQSHEERLDLITRGFEVSKRYSWSNTSQIIQKAYLDLVKPR